MNAIEKVRATTKTHTAGFNPELLSEKLRALGTHVTRYGLVIVLLWIGGMKFTAYEAEGIQPLVANSPLVFPSTDDLAKSHKYKEFKDQAEKEEWDSIFQPIYSS